MSQRSAPWGQLPSGATTVAGVVGYPVAHSLSPLLYNTAFGATGLDWVFVAFPVDSRYGDGVVGAMRSLGLAGIAVTMPHKQAVANTADLRSPTVERIGAANVLLWRNDQLLADSTDGAGLVDSLRQHNFEVEGRRVLLVGAGGAAAAAALALAEAGAAEVAVAARRSGPAHTVASLAGSRGRVASIDEAGEVDLVVQATPVGMRGGPDPEGIPLDPARLSRGQVVADLIYHPSRTPLLAAASARGAAVVEGQWMLLHVVGRIFTLWTGIDAPLPEMGAALTSALGSSSAISSPADPASAPLSVAIEADPG